MPYIYITNANIILKDHILERSSLTINNGKIISVGKKTRPGKDSTVIDARGCFVSPGFIDTHIHGEPQDIFANEIKHGTTSILQTLHCDSLNRIYKKVEKIKKFKEKNILGANLLGIRLEGPYINKDKAGAQNKRFIRRPDKKEALHIIKRCSPLLKVMTLAPEIKGSGAIIKILKRNNIIASIGHTDASYKEAIDGIIAGMTHATHVFNAMSGPEKHKPGTAGAVLTDSRVRAEIILDLIHVPAAYFDLILSLKKLDNIILVTDSVRAAPLPGAKKIRGAYRFKSGKLAGSAMTMMDAVKNAVKIAGISLNNAVMLASLNAARLLKVEQNKGSIAIGKDADIVIFNKNFDVKMTIIRGKIVYRKWL
ncbi:MAG: N-acetylglucosamine-6-phosphate deacetylase [Candidatus Omnitrophica bacterium]|nr:N-acetylglucosamine-6-phosphate deacetylase [Candidatus Omnitrophota bacterium]